MNAQDYVKNVLITEARDFTPVQQRLMDIKNIRLLHASAGITSEIAELFELERKVGHGDDVSLDRVNLMEECGDVLWYVGIACDALNCTYAVTNLVNTINFKKIDFDDDLANEVHRVAARLSEFAGEFADLAIKKTVFYGKQVDETLLVGLLAQIHYSIEVLCKEAGYTVEYARERNIAKLKARYGEKFSEAAALERNLENERNILENK